MTEARLLADREGVATLSGRLDFSNVTRLAEEGRALLAREDDVVIDLGGVSSANSAGLALLLEWLDLARATGTGLSYRNLPESLLGIAAISNLESVLPLSPSSTPTDTD